MDGEFDLVFSYVNGYDFSAQSPNVDDIRFGCPQELRYDLR
jgi:hypothetical protein